MTWESLQALQLSTRMEFTPALAAKHCFVRLASGRWTRALGAPLPAAVWIKGRVYRMSEARP